MKRVFVHRLFDTYDMTTGMEDLPPGRFCMTNYLPYGREFRPYGFMRCVNRPMLKKLPMENSI